MNDKDSSNQVANDLLEDLSTSSMKVSLKAELKAIGRISEAMHNLDKETSIRVLKWAEDRFVGGD